MRTAGIVLRGTRSSRTDDRIIFVSKGRFKSSYPKVGKSDRGIFLHSITETTLPSPFVGLYLTGGFLLAGGLKLFELVASATSHVLQAYKLIPPNFGLSTKSLQHNHPSHCQRSATTHSSILSVLVFKQTSINSTMATKTHKTWQEELLGKEDLDSRPSRTSPTDCGFS